MGECLCCITVGQSDVAILETCGKFARVGSPGFHCLLPWTSVAGSLSLRLQEHRLIIRSKTKDNVFVTIQLTLQVQVIPQRVEAAFYSIENPLNIIRSYVENSVESKIPLYNLEALFIERGTISQQLKNETDAVMDMYGWDIVSALITDIDPGASITNAINSIQKYQRLRVAAVNEAETQKMTRVRAAEALCESRRLAGQGLAEQRKAIVAGLRQSVGDIGSSLAGLKKDDVFQLLLMNQYYDTMKIMAENSGSTLLFVGGANELGSMTNKLRNDMQHQMK